MMRSAARLHNNGRRALFFEEIKSLRWICRRITSFPASSTAWT
jgi:hypothetical protein